MNSISSLVRDNIRKLKPYSSARSEFSGRGEVFLDANENPYETGLNRYPDPLQHALKERIAALKQVQPGQIFLGNGSDEVIDLAIRIFCDPQTDHIITLPPTYGMYQVGAAIADVKVLEIQLNSDFQPNVEAILNAANAHSKLLFLCHPNNPTGNLMAPSAIEALLNGFPGIVVIDEAYIDFAPEHSTLKYLDQYPNMIVMQTLSKAWGLAAIRLGMAFASTEIIEYYNKVKPPYNINILTQETALQELSQEAQKANWVQALIASRARLVAALSELPMIEKVFPSDTNFILVRVNNPKDLYQYLLQQGIIVRDRSTVVLCEGTLRISIGTETENQQLIQALKQYPES
ncbi:MAG: histidinol-phosphate transaminase [Saprospiraceae bacterium]|nr:histidinol-phosphate transaminase [Saprospiraceae bacterium]